MAVIFNDLELIRLLKHFGLPTDFPRFLPVTKYSHQANGPPDDGCQLEPEADLYDTFRTGPLLDKFDFSAAGNFLDTVGFIANFFHLQNMA